MSYWTRWPLQKANPYHDAQGLFTSPGGSAAAGKEPVPLSQNKQIDARMKARQDARKAMSLLSQHLFGDKKNS